jgi:hypothetical protein
MHSFGLGQLVRLCGSFRYRAAVPGDYQVVHHLPNRDGERQYRIKSVGESYERVVKESEIEGS